MKKYIIILIALSWVIVGKAQVIIKIDSINLKIDENEFEKIGQSDFYEFIPQTNNLIATDQGVLKTTPRTAKTATPAMSPMSLSNIPYNYTIDKSKGVGEIAIQSSVENGIANHKVPIEIYSSVGLSPKIHLAYNSMCTPAKKQTPILQS